MHFPGSGKSSTPPRSNNDDDDEIVQLNDCKYVPYVQQFCYLGCILTRDLQDDEEINYRLRKATGAFQSLRKGVFTNRKLTRLTRTTCLPVYVLPHLLYGCETWSMTQTTISKIEVFYNDCLRTILGLSRFSAHYLLGLRNKELRANCKVSPILSLIELHRSRWIEKMANMPPDRAPRKLLNCWINHPRLVGCPQQTARKGYAKTIAKIIGVSPTNFRGSLKDWLPIAKNSPDWESNVLLHLELPKGKYKGQHKSRVRSSPV
jgi:hypothetical protein